MNKELKTTYEIISEKQEYIFKELTEEYNKRNKFDVDYLMQLICLEFAKDDSTREYFFSTKGKPDNISFSKVHAAMNTDLPENIKLEEIVRIDEMMNEYYDYLSNRLEFYDEDDLILCHDMYENIGTISETNTSGVLFFENKDYTINEWIEASIDTDPIKMLCYTKLFKIEYNEDSEAYIDYYKSAENEEDRRIYLRDIIRND